MNEIISYREMLLNRDNEGIIADLLKQGENHNSLWGQEYIMMNEKSFMDNADAIIEIMLKCKNPLLSTGQA